MSRGYSAVGHLSSVAQLAAKFVEYRYTNWAKYIYTFVSTSATLAQLVERRTRNA